MIRRAPESDVGRGGDRVSRQAYKCWSLRSKDALRIQSIRYVCESKCNPLVGWGFVVTDFLIPIVVNHFNEGRFGRWI